MTRLVRFANNATSKLAANLSAVGLTISLTPGDGAKFPALSAGQFFKGTLVKSDGTKEVVKVTARSTDTLTVQRANEAVGGVQTAYSFSAGDKFELRLTAQAIGDELDRLDAAAFLDVVNKSANYTIVETDISKLIKTDTTAGNVTITMPQISTLTGSFEVQISKNTGDGNVVTIARAGADTINGAVSYVLASQYQCVWLVADLSTNTWTAITSANASNKIADQFIGSGTAGPFILSGDPGSKNNTDVYVGGVYQNKSTYTLAGTSLTLGGTVAAGVIIECNWAQPLPVGTPSDQTVTPAKLADATKAAIQSQTWTAFTSAGTAPAYTLTPNPTILAYAAGQRFRVAAHAAGTTGSNTLNVAGLGAKNLRQYDSTGAKVPAYIAAGQLLDVEYDGTDFVVLDAIATTSDTLRIDVASAATVNLTSSAPNTRNINITGTTAITAFTVAAGLLYFVRFNASLTLTNGAGLVTNTGANIVTQAGDTCILRSTAANTVEVLSYARAVQSVLGTAVATTSGTSIDITGITSTAKRVTVMFNQVSDTTPSNMLIQLGSGSVQTTGYAATGIFAGTAQSGVTSTAGFPIVVSQNATSLISGQVVFTHMGGNIWACFGVLARTNENLIQFCAGVVTLSGVLDRLRLTTVSGTSAFDGGSINTLVEYFQ